MSYPPPVTPGYTQQPPPGDWTPPAPKRRGPLPWLIGALVVALLVVGGLIAVLASGGSKPSADASPTPPLPQDPCGGGICQTTAPTPVADIYSPKPSDITLTPKITRKKCFGSAGCNVTFRLELEYSGPGLDPATTWLVSYEIRGVEDGPEIGSLELTGTQFTSQEEDVSTPSSKSKVTIKVTSVEED